MSKDEFDSLVREIGTLRTECEELRVRNEILQYHLERANREMRDLEREVQELSATLGIRVPNFSAHEYDPPAPIGWGKGKDE
jgi:predicted  nucleic acid-binding Zn-ribbon protein